MKILAGVLLPDDGEFFIPPQLRAFHISHEPLFISGSLMENLTMGCISPKEPDAQLERVVNICRRLGATKNVIELIGNGETRNWGESLSASECQMVHLARGLIANPEVLVIHKPTQMFDERTALVVFKALRTYVDEKGIEQDLSGWARRRPRTCLCTITRMSGLEFVDNVLLVNETETRQIRKEEVTDLQMH